MVYVWLLVLEVVVEVLNDETDILLSEALYALTYAVASIELSW